MANYKNIIAETVRRRQNPALNRFVDKHVIDKKDYPVKSAEDDAGNEKDVSRKADKKSEEDSKTTYESFGDFVSESSEELDESRIADAVAAVKNGMSKRDAIRKFGIDGGHLAKALPRDKFYEEKDLQESSVKSGQMKLKDGSSVKLNGKDAKILNDVLSSLTGKNKKEFMETLTSSKDEFEDILEFSREA